MPATGPAATAAAPSPTAEAGKASQAPASAVMPGGGPEHFTTPEPAASAGAKTGSGATQEPRAAEVPTQTTRPQGVAAGKMKLVYGPGQAASPAESKIAFIAYCSGV